MITVISTIIICTSIIFNGLYIAELSKVNDIRTKYAKDKRNIIMLILYFLSFVLLLFVLKENKIFEIFKYIGICVYWIFLSLALFMYLNLLVYHKKDNDITYLKLCSELKKRVLLISIISILWIVANVLLEKTIYIVMSFPIVMTLILGVLLVKFVMCKKNISKNIK